MITTCLWPANGAEENEWDYVLSHFKSDTLFVMGEYQCTNNALRDAPVVSRLAQLPSDPLVMLSPSTARHYKPTISLLDFAHPEDAVYWFGPSNLNLSDEDLGIREPDYIVEIPTDTKDEMFPHVAYAVTMWHRRYG